MASWGGACLCNAYDVRGGGGALFQCDISKVSFIVSDCSDYIFFFSKRVYVK